MIRSEIHQKILNYCLFALAFSLPLLPKIIPLITVFIFLNWIAEGKFKQKFSQLKHLFFLVLTTSYFLIHVIGLFYSQNLNYGFFDIEIKLSLLVFPLILSTSETTQKKTIHNVLYSFITGCIVAAIVDLGIAGFNYIKTADSSFFFYTLLSHFIHPGYFSMYLNLALVTCLYFIFYENGFTPSQRNLFFSIVFFMVFFIIILAAKMGIITLALILIGFIGLRIFTNKKLEKSLILPMLISATLFLIVKNTPQITTRFETVQNSLQSNSSSDTSQRKDSLIGTSESSAVRLLIWKSAISLIKENPLLFGVGTGDVKDALLTKYKEDKLTGAFEHKLNAHNQYIQTTIALGIVGLSIFIFSLFGPLYISIKEKNYLHVFFILIILMNFLTESILEVQAGVVFYAFFNSFLWLSYTKN